MNCAWISVSDKFKTTCLLTELVNELTADASQWWLEKVQKARTCFKIKDSILDLYLFGFTIDSQTSHGS